MRPKVFIGSSTASLPVVRVIERALQNHAEVVAWDSEGLFAAGDIIVDRLVELPSGFQFAILVFGFDDFLVDGDIAVPRDNVLFELGLFMGHLGRRSTFVVVPQMKGKKLKILSDIGGLTFLRYDAPGKPEHLHIFLRPAIDDLIRTIMSPRPPMVIDPAAVQADPDVHSLLARMKTVVDDKRSKSHKVKICNLALDMETTWTYIRDKYLNDKTISGIDWRSLMIDPDGEAIAALQSQTVSTTTAAERIKKMQAFLPKEQSIFEERGIRFQVRAYASIPVMHGFLIDDDVLYLSFCGVQQLPSAENSAITVNELVGAPNAYWQFERKSINPASSHFVSAFASWFDYLWQSGRHIWPLPRTKEDRF